MFVATEMSDQEQSDWLEAPKMLPSVESGNKPSRRQTQKHSAINNAAASQGRDAQVHGHACARWWCNDIQTTVEEAGRKQLKTGGSPAPGVWQTLELHSFRKDAAASPACREY